MDTKEYIIPFENNEYYQGRIVVYATTKGFNADVLITNVESGKIMTAVKQLYNFQNKEDLLQTAVQSLADYLLLKSNTTSTVKLERDVKG